MYSQRRYLQTASSPARRSAMQGMMRVSDVELFGVMIPQRDNVNVNHPTGDGVHQAMLVSNPSAPKPVLLTFQRLWLADARKWMFLDVFKQVGDALHDTLVARPLPILAVFLGTRS